MVDDRVGERGRKGRRATIKALPAPPSHPRPYGHDGHAPKNLPVKAQPSGGRRSEPTHRLDNARHVSTASSSRKTSNLHHRSSVYQIRSGLMYHWEKRSPSGILPLEFLNCVLHPVDMPFLFSAVAY